MGQRREVRRDPGAIKLFGSAAGIGAVSDVDIDGVQADDCAQVIRILSRASRLDRVSIRNVKGTYRDFGVWITPYLREGGNIGRLEFENIDLRPAGPRPTTTCRHSSSGSQARWSR